MVKNQIIIYFEVIGGTVLENVMRYELHFLKWGYGKIYNYLIFINQTVNSNYFIEKNTYMLNFWEEYKYKFE